MPNQTEPGRNYDPSEQGFKSLCNSNRRFGRGVYKLYLPPPPGNQLLITCTGTFSPNSACTEGVLAMLLKMVLWCLCQPVRGTPSLIFGAISYISCRRPSPLCSESVFIFQVCYELKYNINHRDHKGCALRSIEILKTKNVIGWGTTPAEIRLLTRFFDAVAVVS